MKTYPIFSGRGIEKKEKNCFICSKKTKSRITIEVSTMRGDDDIVACCIEHKASEINKRIGA